MWVSVVPDGELDAREATLPQFGIPFSFLNDWTLNTTVFDTRPPSVEEAHDKVSISRICASAGNISLLLYSRDFGRRRT